MGMVRLFSDSLPVDRRQPNPYRFHIDRLESVGAFVVADIVYSDAGPFGGHKVLVFRATAECIRQKFSIDPHFLDRPGDPVARFPGNAAGWSDAILWVRAKGIDRGKAT